MGRKIPAKKHRGVKDPLIQQARRLQSIKGKINAPPKDPDEQPVPRSLMELFAFQNKGQNLQKKKKKKNLRDVTVKASAGTNPIAKLKQLPGETGRGFSLRINSAIRALNEPTDGSDYPMLEQEEREDGRGALMDDWRDRRRRKRAKADDRPTEEPLSRGRRLALKKEERKKAREEASRPEVVYERVSFGEVTHAPPALPAPRHGRGADGGQRPGRRRLLLTGMLEGAGGAGAAGAADTERRERARLDAVAAYRAVKKQRRLRGKGADTRL